MKAGTTWSLSRSEQNGTTHIIRFQPYGQKFLQVHSPTAPLKTNSVSFDDPSHIVVVGVENGRDIWNTLCSEGWSKE